MQSICKRFKQVRLEAGLTQISFAERLKMTRAAVNAIEHFRYCPGVETLFLIKKHFGKSYDWLIEGK